MFAFAIQIYADFSAYTDIARGTSRWLGFELTENFDHPVPRAQPGGLLAALEHLAVDAGSATTSTSRSAARAAAAWLWARNVLVTFLLSGLWHGASWNYVLWGLYHGLLLLVTQSARAVRRFQARRESGRWLLVPQIAGMFVLTIVGWLLFRETELAAIVRDLTLSPFGVSELDRQTGLYLFLLAFVYSMPLWMQSVWVEAATRRRGRHRLERAALAPMPRLVLQGVACGLAFAAILVLRSRTSLDFIYFQF